LLELSAHDTIKNLLPTVESILKKQIHYKEAIFLPQTTLWSFVCICPSIITPRLHAVVCNLESQAAIDSQSQDCNIGQFWSAESCIATTGPCKIGVIADSVGLTTSIFSGYLEKINPNKFEVSLILTGPAGISNKAISDLIDYYQKDGKLHVLADDVEQNSDVVQGIQSLNLVAIIDISRRQCSRLLCMELAPVKIALNQYQEYTHYQSITMAW
jgi:hypothetical protein